MIRLVTPLRSAALILLSCLFSTLLTSPSLQAGTIHVYLQGGQSNADGRALTSQLPTSPIDFQQPQSNIPFYFHGENSTHSLDKTLTTLRPGMSETSGFGPEISFGYYMNEYYSVDANTSVAIVKYANGGTNLDTQWKAGGDNTTTNDGSQYVIFQSTMTDGLAAITAAYPNDTIIISGMIWMQGESDASDTRAPNYETNLTNFIADIRATYGSQLPFLIGEVTDDGPNFVVVRAAQAAVAANDPLSQLIDTDTFSKGDPLHFDANGQFDLGRAFAIGMQGPDTTSPSPDTMTFSSVPTALDDTSITMTATSATDINYVEYFFENTDGNGNDSGWQDSTIYVDSGLTPGGTYSYRVQSRDKSSAQNTTSFSSVATTTTFSSSDITVTELTSTGDTYIQENSADTILGSSTNMITNNNNTRYSFIRFNISSLENITKAKLELETTISSTGQTYEIFALNEAYDTWLENTLTWNNSNNILSSAINLSQVFSGSAIHSFVDSELGVSTIFEIGSGNLIDFLNADSDGMVTLIISEPGNIDGAGSAWATKEHATAKAPTLTLTTITDYAQWTTSYSGLNLNDPYADLDQDGTPNLLESWLGSDPSLSSPALRLTSSNGMVSTLTHGQNETPPDNVTAGYEWSVNLEDWYLSDDTAAEGLTVNISSTTIGSTTTVTLTADEASPEMFIRIVGTITP